jgi:hypothetical protein
MSLPLYVGKTDVIYLIKFSVGITKTSLEADSIRYGDTRHILSCN